METIVNVTVHKLPDRYQVRNQKGQYFSLNIHSYNPTWYKHKTMGYVLTKREAEQVIRNLNIIGYEGAYIEPYK